MKPYILIIAFMISQFCFSQEKKEYIKFNTVLKFAYNNSQYEIIYDYIASHIKKKIALKEFKKALEDIKSEAGNIKDFFFLEETHGIQSYKVNFNKRTLKLNLFFNDDEKLEAFLFRPLDTKSIRKLERNTTKMIWPFKEETYVFWGGITENENYHVALDNQKYAYDITMMKDGNFHKGDITKNENYYIFGKDILATCDAKVVTVVAQCGNSGNSSEPHLHLSLQNYQYMSKAMGAKLYFDSILVNGELKNDYIPVKGGV